MTDAVKRGRQNRRKGASGERELCQLIEAEFGIRTKRLLGQERDGGSDVPLPGLGVFEVKRRKRVANLYTWLESAQMVALRGDGRDWLVVLPWPLFATLARSEVRNESD